MAEKRCQDCGKTNPPSGWHVGEYIGLFGSGVRVVGPICRDCATNRLIANADKKGKTAKK